MSTLLKSVLVLAFAGVVAVACSKKEEAPAVEAAPAPVAAPAEAAKPAPAVVESGGYVPTADERVPGITLDQAALDAAAASAAEATPEAPAAK